MANELKVLSVSPSVKDWPVPIGLGLVVVLTGALLFVLLIVPFRAAAAVLCLGLAALVWPVLKAANTEYVVTNRRVVLREGILGKTELEADLRAVQQVRVVRTPLQETLGIGDVVVEAMAATLVLRGVEEPEKLRERILSLK